MPAARRPIEQVRRVSVLGATGSIGASTLDLIGRDPGRYQVVALTANSQVSELAALALEHKPELAVIGEARHYHELKSRLAGSGIAVAAGASGLIEAASRPAEWIMSAIVGAAGLRPTLAALEQGGVVALANKECLVVGGDLFMRRVEETGATLLPVDSEHSAAFQSLAGAEQESIEQIVLTASGGPFRTWSLEALDAATPEQALKHPNWSMGPKITIDSATLMNKALELIEAFHLFPVRADQLGVLVHPQSIVHCLVHYRDGSVLAQMSTPDMRAPISYSLAWPSRMQTPCARLDLARLSSLTFEAPDETRFPALGLARQVMAAGGSAGAVLNAANEVAVAAFLGGRLSFTGIARLASRTMEAAERRGLIGRPADLDELMQIDAASRTIATELAASG
ncbi:MAG: 1-deoxy-D-xylulose-5-phosphate reductoisomerase [Hyphomicrobiaceae bacterium]